MPSTANGAWTGIAENRTTDDVGNAAVLYLIHPFDRDVVVFGEKVGRLISPALQCTSGAVDTGGDLRGAALPSRPRAANAAPSRLPSAPSATTRIDSRAW